MTDPTEEEELEALEEFVGDALDNGEDPSDIVDTIAGVVTGDDT